MEDDAPIIPPPSSYEVVTRPKVIIYDHRGKPYGRRIGF